MMFQLIKQIINKQNKILWILMSAISFVMASIIAVSVATNVYLSELQQSREQVYGSFSHIIYTSENTDAGDYSTRYGIIDIVNSQAEKDVVYGNVNNLAKSLGKINVANLLGNDIVITEDIAQKFQLKTGDIWKSDAQEWHVKAIIDNIGLLWVKGVTEEIQSFKMPNVIVSPENWQQLVKQFPETKRVWLGQFQSNITDRTWDSIQGSHYRNTFLLEMGARDYHTPEYLLNIASVIFCMIVIVILRAYILAIRKRYHVYELLGMRKLHLKSLFFLEFLCFNMTSVLLGIILCGMITSLFLSVALQRIYIIDSRYLTGYFVKYIIMYGMSFITSILLFASFSTNENKWQRLAHKKLPFDVKKLYLAFNVGLFSMLIVFLVGTLFLNFEAINNGILNTYATGKMADDFDYQFTIASPVERYGQAYYDGSYHELPQNDEEKHRIRYIKSSGELEHIQRQLLERFPSAEVESYVNLSELYLVNKDNFFQQDYLQKLYAVHLLQDRPFWNNLLNQSTELLLTKAIVYPDDKIKWLSSQFSGDVQNVLNGHSAYIVAPAYEYFETKLGDNGMLKEGKPIDKQAPNAVYDTKIEEKSVLSFIELQANSSVYGILGSQLAKKLFDIRHLNVTVEGIAFKHTAWFDVDDISAPYRLIVSKKFLEKNGLDNKATRLRVKIPGLNYEKDNAIIRQITASYPNVQLTDQYEQLKTFRQYTFIQQGFKALLIIVFFTLIILIFNSLIHAHLLEQHQKYLVYGLLGMSRNRLAWSLSLPILGSMLIATVGISVFELRFFGGTNILSMSDWMSLLLNITLPMGICTIVILSLIYYHIGKFMKNI